MRTPTKRMSGAGQDNAGVIVNDKGEMKGSAIQGPVAKELMPGLLKSGDILELRNIV